MTATRIEKLQPVDFPEQLREIPDPPNQLYVRGAPLQADTRYLTVVGSRRYSQYGKTVCQKLIAGLRGHNITIVSGLALGIDSIAHKAALEHDLPTLAIPGSGLDDSVLYPRSHVGLAHSILAAGGTLLSEFDPTAKPQLYFFPKRNRIMAGLAHAVLVIEAGQKSGTLITTRLATDYNRDVLVVPGQIYSPQSEGSHMLLRLGATLVRDSNDILEALGIENQAQSTTPQSLSTSEHDILKALSDPKTRDDLANALALPISELNVTLSGLELKGLVSEQVGKIHRI